MKRTLQRLLKSRVPFQAERTFCKVDVLDLDGTCRVTRGWIGIRVASGLNSGPTRLRSYTKESSISNGRLQCHETRSPLFSLRQYPLARPSPRMVWARL
jgi:hypothetical protein